MKTLFEKHKGERAFTVLAQGLKMEGKVGEVSDEYIELETTYSGPERIVYIPFTAIMRVHFDPAWEVLPSAG